nr:DNA double-strand break repair nuclease NurA [Candidatus Njordarchaeota archaeon]
MPKFVDLFVNEVRRKRDYMKLKLVKGSISALDEDFQNLLMENWHPLPQELTNDSIGDIGLSAVDGSRGLRDYANGSRLFVVRGLALTNAGEQFRRLETEIFMSQESEIDIDRYIRQKTESIEIAAATEVAPHLKGSRRFILIDGSLYGRMFHLLRDSPVEGDRDFILRYVNSYAEFLHRCKDENIILVGVSKDSRAHFLRDLFLKRICSTELKKLDSSLREEEISELQSCFSTIHDKPGLCFHKLERLTEKYGSKLAKLKEIMLEFLRSRPDFQLIMNFAPEAGYCTPIELAADQHFLRELHSISKDAKSYVRRHFRNALLENMSQEDQFVAFATKVVGKVLEFPTIISFHLFLDRRSTPLRIDIPSWVLRLSDTLSSLGAGSRSIDLHNNLAKVLDEIISLLRSGYSGLEDYNIWLKRVDDEVKLRRVDMDTIYERVLEKELGVTLIHTRGYRRVKFP